MEPFKRSFKVHPGYLEFEEAFKKAEIDIPCPVGKYQYTYTSKKGKISLIQLKDRIYNNNPWEIYCLEGNLFSDIERFSTKRLAEDAIEDYLT